MSQAHLHAPRQPVTCRKILQRETILGRRSVTGTATGRYGEGPVRTIIKISERIQELRKSAELTVTELAAMSGMPESQVRRYENGTMVPCLKSLQRICRALGVGLAEFSECDFQR